MYRGEADIFNVQGILEGLQEFDPKELYEAVAKDVLGIRQGMRELRRTEVDAAIAYLDKWLPDLFGGFMTVSRSITKGEGEEEFSYNYRHGMFAFPTPDNLKDYTYGSSDILAMRGSLAGSHFQGNIFIDDYEKHPLEVLVSDIEVVGRYSRHLPHFVERGATSIHGVYTKHYEDSNQQLRKVVIQHSNTLSRLWVGT